VVAPPKVAIAPPKSPAGTAQAYSKQMRCLLFFCGMSILLAQDPVFRTSTSLVRIDAEVVDPSGRLIPGLKTTSSISSCSSMPRPA
jgi:hypothetical protein